MDKWKLIMKGTESKTVYQQHEFIHLENYCRLIIDDGMEKLFTIEYYQNEELIETVKVTDYFNS